MKRAFLFAGGLVASIASAALAVDLNRVTPGAATIVEQDGGPKTYVKQGMADFSKSKEKALVKTVEGDNAKAKDLVKNVTGDKAKEKELVKTVTSSKEKERLLVKEIVPLETSITVTPSRSRLYTSKLPIERFSISNPQLIEVIQYSPFEFELLGRNAGACSLTIWFGDASGGESSILRMGVRISPDE